MRSTLGAAHARERRARRGGGDRCHARRRHGLAGREQEPAESVFRNIKVLKGVPAGRVVRIMQNGYARSLGVTCGHCHVGGQWASDTKPTKQVARDMHTMVMAINTQHIAKIPNLRGERPAVNCMTCHRGRAQPNTNTQ
jgi:photosynthetic reaction center cytochrome c subunit